MNKVRRILIDKRGVSELISCLVGLFAISMMLVVSLSFIRVVNRQAVLNEFANQMIIAVCDYGTTDSTDIDDRYDQLVESLDIAPTISYDADYLTGSKVQYGDEITLVASSTESVEVLGYSFDMDFSLAKTGRSNFYWKQG